MGVIDSVREQKSGMMADLVFAIAWVVGVNLLFDLTNGPQWAYYLCMFAGVVAYFGFFASLKMARAQQ